MESIALDLANGFIKVKSNTTTKCYVNKIRRIKHSAYSVMNEKSQVIYEYEDEKYVLDPINGVTSGGRNNQRYSSEQYRLECLIAIAQVTKSDEISLTLGLPCKDYDNEEIHSDIEINLAGRHVIKIIENGKAKNRVIEIKDIHILCEPVGTLLDLIIGKDLNIDEDLASRKYLIVDIGFGTMDIIKTQGLRVMETAHANLGTMTLIGEYVERINANYGSRDISFKEDDVTSIPQAKINKYQKEWNFTKELELARKYFAKEVTSEINRKNVSYADYDAVVFTGGACLEIDGYLQLPSNALIHLQCQTANVSGYHKYGLIQVA